MTNTDVKKMLYNYTSLDRYISDCEKELQEIQDKINVNYDVGSSITSDMPRGTGISDKTYNAVANIEKLKEMYVEQIEYLCEKIRRYYKEKRKLEKVLEQLSEFEHSIINMFYFRKMSWNEIYAEDKKNNPNTYRSISTLQNKNNEMCKKIANIIKKTGD